MDMKKLSLKLLGDSGIKTLCKSYLFVGLLMAFCLAACSDDDDDTVVPVFPEKQNLICNAGETREFTFTANADWSLASSAIWCKLQTNDTEEFILSGIAGTYTVTLIVTDDNQKVDNISVAKLELTMGGQTIVIGEVTRSAVNYELKIYDKDGNEIAGDGELEVGYKDFAQFSVQANFRFAATNLPGWVELEGGSLVGAVNQKVKGGLKIIENESREKYPVEASEKNVITFSDEEGRAFRSFRVFYEGMTPGVMDLTRPSSNQYDWVVSLDGKTFTQSGGGIAGTGGSGISFKNRLPFTVKTLKDAYKVVFVEKGKFNDELYVVSPDEEWMSCEDDNGDGNVKLLVDAYAPESWEPAERVGYVLVFSAVEYESIKENLEAAIIDGEEIVRKYEQANLVFQFTQKEIKSGGETQFFSAQDINTGASIECTTYTGDDASDLMSVYGVQGITEIKQPVDITYVTVAFQFMDYRCYYLDDRTDAVGVIDGSGNLITVSAASANGRDIFIVVSGEAANEKAMLIVRTSHVSGGGDEQQKFVVANGTAPVVYNGSDAQTLINMHNLTGIYKTSGQSMDIEMIPSAIRSFKVYDLSSGDGTDITASSSADCAWGYNDFGNEQIGKINVWFGGGSSLEGKTVLIAVTCENDEIYGIVASKNGN